MRIDIVVEMFDNKGMATLSEYIKKKPKRTHAEWAAFFGTSRSNFTGVLNGKTAPSHKLMASIMEKTGGKVKPASFFKADAA